MLLRRKRRDWIDRLFVDRVANYVSGIEVWKPQKPLVVRGSAIETNRLRARGLRLLVGAAVPGLERDADLSKVIAP